MERSVIIKIVKIFRNDSHIYESRREELYDLLNPSSPEYSTVKDLQPYEFFSRVLKQWISDSGNGATVLKLWEICYEEEFRAVADKLKENFPNEFSTPSASSGQIDIDETPVSFDMNHEVQRFTGRTKELQKLQEYFDGGEEYVVTIAGMGGMGKSELAKRFARSLKQKHQITTIWFNGQNQETLKDSVDRLAKQLGVEPKNISLLTLNDKFHQSTSKMASKMKKRKLVIIDNVDEANAEACSLIKANLPNKDIFFLVTSRNLGVLEFVGEIIKLDTFPESDAMVLVTASLKRATNEDNTSFKDGVKKLCKLLGNFPLALQQAISYIKRAKHISRENESYTISDYVESYEQRNKKYLGHKLDAINHDYKETTLFTWQVTIDKIKDDEDIGAAAIELLYAIAFFEPDRIPISFAQRFISGDVDEAIELLQTYSLIKCEDKKWQYSLIKCEDKKFLSIHRLLQEVTRLNVFHTHELEMEQLRKITRTVVELLEDMNKQLDSLLPKRWETMEIPETPLLPEYRDYREGLWHMISVWEHVSSRHSQLIVEFKTVPVNIIDHLNPFQGELIFYLGDFVVPFTDRVHSLYKTIFGPNASETLELECILLLCRRNDSRTIEIISGSEMLKVFDDILKRYKSTVADDNPLTLRIRERFIYGFYYTYQNSFVYSGEGEDLKKRFKEHCRYFLEWRERVRGSNAIHVSTIRVRWVLAVGLGKKDVEVLELLEGSASDAASVWGEGHWNTREIIGELAGCLFDQKEFARVMHECQRFLQFSNCNSALDSDVKQVRYRLSASFYYLGDRERAFEVFQDLIIPLQDKVAKSLFLEMKRLSDSADECLNSKGDTLKAFKKYQQLNRTQRKFLEEHELRTGLTFSGICDYFWWWWETNQKIAACLIQLHKSAAAVEILEKVTCQWKSIAGQDHRLTIEAMELLQKAEKGLTTPWDQPHHSHSSETKSGQEYPDWQDTNIRRYNLVFCSTYYYYMGGLKQL